MSTCGEFRARIPIDVSGMERVGRRVTRHVKIPKGTLTTSEAVRALAKSLTSSESPIDSFGIGFRRDTSTDSGTRDPGARGDGLPNR